MVCNVGGTGTRCKIVIFGIGGGGRDREALRARARDDERGGTLPGGMLYILEKLLSAGLDGDGVRLGGRPRRLDLTSLLSKLIFLSGSLFSARLSRLGGFFDRDEGFRERDTREVLRGRLFSTRSLCGIASAKLGSVSSRISDKGRAFAQEGAFAEWPLCSPEVLLTMPP